MITALPFSAVFNPPSICVILPSLALLNSFAMKTVFSLRRILIAGTIPFLALGGFLVACEQQAANPCQGSACLQAASLPTPSSVVAAVKNNQSASSKNMRMLTGNDAKILRTLMTATFGKGTRADGRAQAYLPQADNRKQRASHLLTPLAYASLEDGHTILIANATPLNHKQEEMVSHAAGGQLNIFWLKQESGQWHVLSRQENIAVLGSNGELGEVKFASLGNGQTALAIQHGGTWQGYSTSVLSLFHLLPGGARELNAPPIPLASDNEGACGPETEHCWNVQGEWKFSRQDNTPYPDLILNFSGDEAHSLPRSQAQAAADQEAERRTTQIKGQAIYRFQKDRYVLIKGQNLVPAV